MDEFFVSVMRMTPRYTKSTRWGLKVAARCDVRIVHHDLGDEEAIRLLLRQVRKAARRVAGK